MMGDVMSFFGFAVGAVGDVSGVGDVGDAMGPTSSGGGENISCFVWGPGENVSCKGCP